MQVGSRSGVSLRAELRQWWKRESGRRGVWPALRHCGSELLDFLRDSTPSRRRQRYGDMDYDWDYRMDTTSGSVGWRDRLLGVFHSAYQPTEPWAFREMIGRLGVDYSQFTFIDLGSGKGRTLLMAAEFPFRRIVGVELLPALHQVALANIERLRNADRSADANPEHADSAQSTPHVGAERALRIEAICADACKFQFPAEPTVLFLFNPLPETGLEQVIRNLERSLAQHPRPVLVVYHNAVLRHVVDRLAQLRVIASGEHYLVYANSVTEQR